VQIASVSVPRPVDACWRAFTSPAFWMHWVPGLRSARVLAATPEGLPGEVQFTYAAGVTYVLRYGYDLQARVVRWEPRAGDHGGVRGFARFDADEAGTRFVYGLEHDGTRTSPEADLDDPQSLAEAFARYMEETAIV
jgi:hypothetical protein